MITQVNCYKKNFGTSVCIKQCQFRSQCDAFDPALTKKNFLKAQAELAKEAELLAELNKKVAHF